MTILLTLAGLAAGLGVVALCYRLTDRDEFGE